MVKCAICGNGVKLSVKSKCVFEDEQCKEPSLVHKKCDDNLYGIAHNAQKMINELIMSHKIRRQ